MALELATRLILRSSEDGSPLTADRVRSIASEWAKAPIGGGETVDVVPGRNGSRVSTNVTALPDGRCRWDLHLVRTDDTDPSVEWAAELSALSEPDRTTLVVRLRRESHDHRLRPLRGSAAPPRVIRDIVSAAGVDCFDGPTRVTSRYRILGTDEISGFVSMELTAEDRRLPILAVASVPPGVEGRLNIDTLAKVLAGFAHVVVVERKALPELGRQVSELSLAPSAARLWWPGLSLDDDSSLHPTFVGPFEDPTAVVETIRRRVLSVSRDRWREPGRLVEFGRDVRHERDAAGRAVATRVAEEIARLREEASAQREAQELDKGATQESTETAKRLESQLASMAENISGVQDELKRQQEAVQNAEDHWLEAEEERTRLELANLALQGRVDGLTAQLRERALAAGDEEISDELLFERDIRESYETRLTAQDRELRPLAPFVVREGFVESVVSVAADRQKVVDAAMEVACGLAKEMEGRKLHRMRSSDAASSPARVRAHDSATAWRCNLQTKAASARRLHYWSCPDGTIEFVNVTIHDDFSIAD